MATVEQPRRPVFEPAIGQSGQIRRDELGAFLRSRRERISPERVGLRSTRRRRTPGLRREEVAQLAGVGVTWYTWLEQGRDINPSAQVLEAIAQTLLFEPAERTHLFTLAGVAPTAVANGCTQLPSAVQPLLDRLEPYPALAVNGRYDILAFNRIWASSFPHIHELPAEQRNCIWLIFTDRRFRRTVVDAEDAAARMVANFRAAMAEHVAEPAWKHLVARLRAASPEFERVWERHDVQAPENRVKRIRHPGAGVLALDYTYLWLDPRLGTRIVAYTPADEPTAARLRKLQLALDSAERLRA